MPYATVGELMTEPGISVRRGTATDEVTGLLDEHAISAVPVVDDEGCPVGVVSRGDLRTAARRSGPDGGAGSHAPRRPVTRAGSNPVTRPVATGRRPAHSAATAGEVMTSPAVTARPGWSVAQAARTMERRGVGRLAVVDGTDRLVGFLGRADLLRVFVRTDRAVRREIAEEVLYRTLGIGPTQVTVTVTDGRVTLQGIVEHRAVLPVVDRLTWAVYGVVEVRNHLACLTDAPTGVSSRSARR